MATVNVNATYTLTLLDLNVDLALSLLRMSVGFTDVTGKIIHAVRTLTVKTDLSVRDDLGNSMPAAASSFKNAITGGGANSGLVPEANSYITTNAASFVI